MKGRGGRGRRRWMGWKNDGGLCHGRGEALEATSLFHHTPPHPSTPLHTFPHLSTPFHISLNPPHPSTPLHYPPQPFSPHSSTPHHTSLNFPYPSTPFHTPQCQNTALTLAVIRVQERRGGRGRSLVQLKIVPSKASCASNNNIARPVPGES